MALTKAHSRMIEGAGISVIDYGADPTGATDSTSAINLAMAALTNNSSLVFPPGDYVYQGGISSSSFDGLTNVSIIGYGARLKQPVETTTGRSSTRKTLYILNSTNISVSGLSFYGNHLDLSADDNAFEAGLVFDGCTDCVAIDCRSENLQRGFIAQNSCVKIIFSNCSAKTTYNSFLALNSEHVTFSQCISDGAHYYPPGATASDKSAGYGFLSDQSLNVTFDACTSLKGGSECFRTQHSTAGSKTNTIFSGCKSIQTRRYAYSIRSNAGYSSISDCSALDVGDTSVWDSSTYFEPWAANVYGVIVDSVGSNNVVSSTKVLNLIATGRGIQIGGNQDNLIINGCTVEVPADGRGITISSATVTYGVITNNVLEITGATGTPYGLDVIGCSKSIIRGNVVNGGYDGLVLGAGNDDNVISDNVIFSCMRNGLNISGSRNVVSNNNIKDVAQTVATGAGIYLNGASNILGPNIVSDTQGVPTLYRALWLTANATSTALGPVTEFGTSTGIRSDVAITASKSPLYGKGATATDITTLLTSLRNAAIIET